MKKILIVEDNEDNIFLFQTLFSLRDFKLFIVKTGQLALQLVKQESLDLILMDIQLPDMSGFEVARFIREGGDKKTDIIAVTSYAMVGDREKCLSGGFSGYIEKPIDPEQFLSEIDQYLC